MKNQNQPQKPNYSENNPKWQEETEQKGSPRPQHSPGARPEKQPRK